jgi:hypothetical protein
MWICHVPGAQFWLLTLGGAEFLLIGWEVLEVWKAYSGTTQATRRHRSK